MNDTRSKNKNAQNRLQSLESGGFIRLFVIIVVVVAVLIYFGLDPKGVWENLIKPVVEWGFNIFIKVVGFLFDIAIWLVAKLASTLGM
jgi:hypothetical protein